jgi:hypothetical protein
MYPGTTDELPSIEKWQSIRKMLQLQPDFSKTLATIEQAINLINLMRADSRPCMFCGKVFPHDPKCKFLQLAKEIENGYIALLIETRGKIIW